MIRNERDYRITHAVAETFRLEIAQAEKQSPPKGVHPKLHEASIEAMHALLADLDRELKDYADLKAGRVKKREGRLENLGELLVKARIARGWTEQELANRLGLDMQKIQQYEADSYERASATRLLEVARTLGVVMHIRAEILDLPDVSTLTAAAPKVSTKE
jgi:HTH-type transcriptional regulator/antitoxin HigA